MGHLKQDFDTGAYLSEIYLYVTNVLFHYFAFYLIMPSAVRAQFIQDRKQRLAIQTGSYPQYACSSHIFTHSWLLMPFARINLSIPGNNSLENNIVDHGSLHWELVKIYRPGLISSRSIPANVCAAFDYVLQTMSVMPEPGRDRISLLRLWLSYKVIVSEAIGRCPVMEGTFVPHIHILITQISLHASYQG